MSRNTFICSDRTITTGKNCRLSETNWLFWSVSFAAMIGCRTQLIKSSWTIRRWTKKFKNNASDSRKVTDRQRRWLSNNVAVLWRSTGLELTNACSVTCRGAGWERAITSCLSQRGQWKRNSFSLTRVLIYNWIRLLLITLHLFAYLRISNRLQPLFSSSNLPQNMEKRLSSSLCMRFCIEDVKLL